jgi:membrane associated rhomboid family serine protease
MLFWYACQIGSVFFFRILEQYAASSSYGQHHALATNHVAYFAHIGGFLCGIVLGYLLSPKNQEEHMLTQSEVTNWKRVR